MTQTTILVVEDDATLRSALCDTLELAGYRVSAMEHGQMALDKLANEPIGLLISDLQMKPMDGKTLLRKAKAMVPDLPVVMMTAYGTVQSAVDAMHLGASDYLLKPFDAVELLKRVEQYMWTASLADEDMIACSSHSRELQTLARRVAATDTTILINGESGTGKEVLAQFLHKNSQRSEAPFVAINCAAIPENMLEATLFGYEKGAFTGASQAYAGKFEQANHGTLLLDEVSEMDLALQAKLLRVLQEREVERIGGRKMLSLDVRILATTNRKLQDEVKAGRFREDLFYRLNVFPLHLQPLRNRIEDIVPIVQNLLSRHCKRSGQIPPVISTSAQQKLQTHGWPGNVRELDNVLQRALILQSGQTIEDGDIIFEAISAFSGDAGQPTAPDYPAQSMVDEISTPDLRSQEQRHILDVLGKNHGSRRQSAKELGISERTLRYKIARFREQGINVPERFGRNSA